MEWYDSTMSQSTDTTVLDFANYLTEGLPPEVAVYFARLPEPNPKLLQLLSALAEKANEGTLCDDEQRQYERLVDLTDFVSLLRLKARMKSRSGHGE